MPRATVLTPEPLAAQGRASPLLELQGVSKTFGAVQALRDLALSVTPGEFVTVVDPSGCGKSTLFNMVAGLDEPDPGGISRVAST